MLCLGIGDPNSSTYARSNLASTVFPTIFDYEFVVINLDMLSVSYYKHIAKKKDEFRKFFQTKGICFVIMRRYGKYEDSSNYDWCPFADRLEIENKSGQTVICKSVDAKFIFDSIKFEWKCFFSEYPENTMILATNRANDPISIMVPY